MIAPGAITNTVTLGDVDGDNTLDVVVGTTSSDGEGAVWVFGAADGTKLPSFPVKLQNRQGGTLTYSIDRHRRRHLSETGVSWHLWR